MHADLLRRTRDVIAGCECEHGCPTCVGPVGNTGPLAKLVALRILDRLAQVSLRRHRVRRPRSSPAPARRGGDRSSAGPLAGRASTILMPSLKDRLRDVMKPGAGGPGSGRMTMGPGLQTRTTGR